MSDCRQQMCLSVVCLQPPPPTAVAEQEMGIVLNSVADTITPKLVADDLPLFRHLLADFFPRIHCQPQPLDALRQQLERAAQQRHLRPGRPLR